MTSREPKPAAASIQARAEDVREPEPSRIRRFSSPSTALIALAALVSVSCSRSPSTSETERGAPAGRQDVGAATASAGAARHGVTSEPDTLTSDSGATVADEGVDARGIPHYSTRALSSEDADLTSNHSYGRALDVVVDDGNRAHPRTMRDWIAFRRWVTQYRAPTGESFRVLGRPDYSWDWPHVELPSSTIGFETIDQAIARGRACLAPGATIPCNFPPHLPAYLSHALVR